MSNIAWRLVLLAAILALVSCQQTKSSTVALEPDGPEIEKVYQEGRMAYAQGEYDLAAEKFARVVEADPAHFNAWVNWGVALSKGGKPLQALAKFQQALNLDPNNLNNAEVYHNWGVALERLGKHQEAIEKFEQAIVLKDGLLTPALQRYIQRHRPQTQETQVGGPSPSSPMSQ